jgi:CheY-like chemotaxis protein
MSTNIAVADETFVVPCTNCLKMYDALGAEWCNCIGEEQSLRCPYCGRCFCRAATEYKTEFWRVAPRQLYELRRGRGGMSARDRFTAVSGAMPGEVTRPLVLVVDDSKLIRATTLRAIRALGYGAMEAADAEQALALTLLYHPELVLSDALMPKVDGRDLCRTIKNSPSTRGTKVAIMTGLYKAPHYKYEAFHTFGVDEYLLKPIEQEELRKLLERMVGRRRRPAASVMSMPTSQS